MAERKKVIPAADEAFNNRFNLICQVVTANTASNDAPIWNHIPVDKRTELNSAYALWFTAYSKTLTPHSKVETEEKNEARAGAEHILRRFIQRYLYDAEDAVSDSQLMSMDLPPRDHIRTGHGIPAEHVALEIRPAEAAELRIDYTCVESGKRARPDETYKGVVLYTRVLAEGEEVPPVEQFQESELMTRSPYVKKFDSSLRGRRVAFSASWENGTGKEGSRCPPEMTVIP